MISDLVESLVNRPNFTARAHPLPDRDFEVGVSDARPMIRLVLRRQRTRSGLTLQQTAERLGATSGNTYTRYEQGTPQPTLEKLNQLLQAVAPDQDHQSERTTSEIACRPQSHSVASQPLNPESLCAPSQNGLFFEAPQRHKV